MNEQAELADITSGMDRAAIRTVVEIVALYRDNPAWAIWLPVQGIWTATRPAANRLPAPDLPMIWLKGPSARQLADQMRATDQQLTGS